MKTPIKTPIKTILISFLLAVGFSTSLSAQDEVASQTNRMKTPPSISKEGEVTFTLAVPRATAVMLGGDWLTKRLPMTKDDKGNWTLSQQLPPRIYSYYFIVDGVKMLDPSNMQIKQGRLDNASSIEVPGNPPMPWEMRNVPHGDVTTITYDSKDAGDQRRVTIYTPPGYKPGQATKLPVLYLLHGNGEIESSWVQYGRANLIADNLLAHGLINPMIIVMPKGHAYKSGQTPSLGVPVVTAFNASVFKDDLFETIIPLVEKRFSVKTDQPNRAIIGLSMGGAQSFKIGLGNLDRFSQVGLFSAGSSSPEVLASMTANPKAANEKIKLLWIGCGRLDRGFAGVEKLHEELTKAGIVHTFKPTDGAHVWLNWRDYLAETLPLLFR